MSENGINVELLEKVKQHILEEPRRYSQFTFGTRSTYAPCGTRACIAGWTDVLANGTDVAAEEDGWGIRDRAMTALGLTDSEADILFAAAAWERWPEPFASRYNSALVVSEEAKARAAADYLDWIIKHGKVTE